MSALNRVLPLLVAALALGAGCGGEPQSSCGPTKATVSAVTDGDTITLSTGEKVRYLMVNAPETTMGKNECWGHEASNFNTDLVLNKEVELRYDQECKDRYGRLLAYVTVEGREVNTVLVERGYGCVMHISPNGDDRAEEFKALQSKAKSAGRGVWACDPVPCL